MTVIKPRTAIVNPMRSLGTLEHTPAVGLRVALQAQSLNLYNSVSLAVPPLEQAWF